MLLCLARHGRCGGVFWGLRWCCVLSLGGWGVTEGLRVGGREGAEGGWRGRVERGGGQGFGWAVGL